MNHNKKLVFLCGARDFHAMDWYKSAKELMKDQEVIILTDLIAGEGFKKLVGSDDKVERLLILDKVLFKKPSRIGNLWRNILKLFVLPTQVLLLKRYAKRNPDAVYHAHSMYYLWLAWLGKVPFVGTPQGSDILIKPFRSKMFKFLSAKAMNAAKAITVDSVSMQEKALEFSGVKPLIIQNGIDILSLESCQLSLNGKSGRTIDLLSIRGFAPLYRLKEIVEARNSSPSIKNLPISFIYPFYEDQYKSLVVSKMNQKDLDRGRVNRNEMYQLMFDARLVVSIPISDSSPRSVYESIFCGCAVAIVYNKYYDILPQCMRDRIIIVNIENENWLKDAIEKSKIITQIEYVPSQNALELFDQRLSFKQVEQLLYI